MVAVNRAKSDFNMSESFITLLVSSNLTCETAPSISLYKIYMFYLLFQKESMKSHLTVMSRLITSKIPLYL